MRSKLLDFLVTSKVDKIFIVDNSNLSTVRSFCLKEKIIYIHNPTNPGSGAAHNIGIQKATESGSKYHFIVNPDIYFMGDAISPMIERCKKMQKDASIGMMRPQILNTDGSIQNLPKLLPCPLSILWRKIRILGIANQ